jgi:predicted ArsR family transcriptional regulator
MHGTEARYRAAMTAADRPRAQDAYRELSQLLLGVLAGGRDPGEVGRAAGRLIAEAARSSHTGAPDDALAALEGFLESRGFMPEMVTGRPGIEFRLGCCPLAEAVLVNPALICGLHRAVAEGVLEALGGAFEVTRLVARHPMMAGCRLELRAIRPGTTQSECCTADGSADCGRQRNRWREDDQVEKS